MVNKKYTLLAVLLLTLGVASYAQTSTFAWDWKDSSVVPEKSIGQYQEFMQNKNPFPAKPRNAWEISAAPGLSVITGDSKLGTGLAGCLTARKAITNVFSYRLGYFGAMTTGKGSFGGYDFKNYSHNASIEFVGSLNTFSNYRGDPTSNLYAFVGAGFMMSGSYTKDPTTGKYVATNPPAKYTLARSVFDYHTRLFSTVSFGVGYAYKINKNFNIGIEERFLSPIQKINFVTGQDLGTGTKNFFYATYIKLNYNLMRN